MDITINKVQEIDATNLFEFELENREFFEQMVPSRGDDYYNFESFKIRHEALLHEQSQGVSYFYLIKDKEGTILGRMNVIDIDKAQKQGSIGYRVGKKYTGRGIANQAIKLLLATASKQGIQRILAKTTNNNQASGFKHIKTSEEKFEMNGQKLMFVYYEWSL